MTKKQERARQRRRWEKRQTTLARASRPRRAAATPGGGRRRRGRRRRRDPRRPRAHGGLGATPRPRPPPGRAPRPAPAPRTARRPPAASSRRPRSAPPPSSTCRTRGPPRARPSPRPCRPTVATSSSTLDGTKAPQAVASVLALAKAELLPGLPLPPAHDRPRPSRCSSAATRPAPATVTPGYGFGVENAPEGRRPTPAGRSRWRAPPTRRRATAASSSSCTARSRAYTIFGKDPDGYIVDKIGTGWPGTDGTLDIVDAEGRRREEGRRNPGWHQTPDDGPTPWRRGGTDQHPPGSLSPRRSPPDRVRGRSRCPTPRLPPWPSPAAPAAPAGSRPGSPPGRWRRHPPAAGLPRALGLGPVRPGRRRRTVYVTDRLTTERSLSAPTPGRAPRRPCSTSPASTTSSLASADLLETNGWPPPRSPAKEVADGLKTLQEQHVVDAHGRR